MGIRPVALIASVTLGVSLCSLGAEGPRIAFSSGRGGVWDIYVVDLEDDNTRRLTKHPAIDRLATWSPDGERLAFGSNRDGERAIHIMDSDGRNARRLEGVEGPVSHPSWSPDGKRIAYLSGGSDLNTIRLSTNEIRFLTDGATNSTPAWSPDGRLVAYSGWGDEQRHWDVLAVNARGGNPWNITDSKWEDKDPTWSPDGRQIAFSSWRKQGRAIHIMDADGLGLRAVTPDEVATNQHVNPSWSADGRWIAYDSRSEVHVLDMSAGMSRVVATGGRRNENAAIWTPAALGVSPVGRMSVAWGLLKSMGARASR